MTPVVAATPDRVPDVSAKVEEQRKQVLDDEYQQDLPGTEQDSGGASGTTGGDWRSPRGSGNAGSGETGSADGAQARREGRDGRIRDDDYRHRDTRNETGEWDGGPLSSLFQFLLWGVVIVGIALLVFWLGSELMGYGGDDKQLAATDDDAANSAVDLAVIQRPLGDAEELAARAEYTEAIHTLLLRTLQELVRSAAVRVSPAMTSREILARVPLLADAREALAGLITAVEITHFGGDPATQDDYVRCRDQFQKFATAFRAGVAQAGRMPSATGVSLA
ncbi:MAG: DUF4129 domain-containing protein [Kofleriaceae bacterium]